MDLGWRSTILLLGAVQGVTVAMLLLTRRRNRVANRCLAALLFAFTLALIPSLIGFAGAYKKFPWLTLAPWDWSLGFGPLLYFYVRRLLTGELPSRWPLHLLPLLVQVVYYTVLFAQPLDWKYEYQNRFHAPWIVPAETGLAVVSALLYWVAAARIFRAYREWVPQRVSDSEDYNLTWVRNFLVGLVGGILVWMAFEGVSQWITPLSYEHMYWLYLMVAVLTYSFGISGYRHAELKYPEMTRESLALTSESVAADPAPVVARGPDWPQRLAGFSENLRSDELYLNLDLTLDGLARELATNSWTLSRSINEGAGENFNDYVNRFRVERVQKRLLDPKETRSILEVALDCGFKSKTSFNRSFKKLVGATPSAWRREYQILNADSKSGIRGDVASGDSDLAG